MAVAALVPVEEYLSSSYEEDKEYVDGRLIDRNVGDFSHSFLQVAITLALKAMGLGAYTGLRFQVKPRRYRVPDVLALAPGQKRDPRFQCDPPYLVIEVLSSEDRVGELAEKLHDYFEKRVPNIWVVDPSRETLSVYRPNESHIVRDRVTTSDGAVTIDVADLFRQMREDEES